MARPLLAVLPAVLGFAPLGCGTVDPGPQFQFAEVVFDQNFFYCKVEPKVILADKCGSGDPSKDTSGCHFSVTSFKLQDHAPVDCGPNGNSPAAGVPSEAQGNWGAASAKMSIDPDRAALLRRPTQLDLHPRQIFPEKSPEADLIRQWATRYSSR